MSREAAVLSPDTSFVQALAVPQLAEACIRMLDSSHPDQPGSGLKTLRIISSDARKVLMSAVQGYTLQLGGDEYMKRREITRAVRFHKQTRLVCLRLAPSPPTPGPREFPIFANFRDPTEAASQLLLFLGEMGTSLSGVTRLEITLGNSFNAEALEIASCNKWWDPLSDALPQLRQLSVHGKLGLRDLRNLGGFCPHLSTLEVGIMDLPVPAMTSLQTLLPHLTSLTLLPGTRCPVSNDDAALMTGLKAVGRVLRSCPGLLFHNNGPYPASQGLWWNLPKGLQQLQSFFHNSLVDHSDDCPPPVAGIGTQIEDPSSYKPLHSSLSTLQITVKNAIWLHEITDFLRAAPQLAHLHVEFEEPSLHVMYSPTRPRDHTCLAERVAAGLALNITPCSSSQPGAEPRCVVIFAGVFRSDSMKWGEDNGYQACRGPDAGDVTLAEFLACLPPLRGITHADVRANGSPETAVCLAHIARIFPCVEKLTVNDMVFTQSDPLTLAPCKALQKLHLKRIAGLDVNQVAALCEQLPLLRDLYIYHCEYFWDENEGADLVTLLGAEGPSAVEVEVEDGYIEGMYDWEEEFQDPSDMDEWERSHDEEQEQLRQQAQGEGEEEGSEDDEEGEEDGEGERGGEEEEESVEGVESGSREEQGPSQKETVSDEGEDEAEEGGEVGRELEAEAEGSKEGHKGGQ